MRRYAKFNVGHSAIDVVLGLSLMFFSFALLGNITFAAVRLLLFPLF